MTKIKDFEMRLIAVETSSAEMKATTQYMGKVIGELTEQIKEYIEYQRSEQKIYATKEWALDNFGLARKMVYAMAGIILSAVITALAGLIIVSR